MVRLKKGGIFWADVRKKGFLLLTYTQAVRQLGPAGEFKAPE